MAANPHRVMTGYTDRTEAGSVLADELVELLKSQKKEFQEPRVVLVLALPRGGVPVGFEIARALGAALDVLLVRKLGVPGSEELAMGAIAEGGFRVFNEDVIAGLSIAENTVEQTATRERQELERRGRLYRDHRAAADISGKQVILVDDGLATGATMRVAVQAVRQRAPASIIVAVPVGAQATCDSLKALVDELICPLTPEHFDAVGRWYRDFSPVSDDQVRELLVRANCTQ